jgi:hypothetical protein
MGSGPMQTRSAMCPACFERVEGSGSRCRCCGHQLKPRAPVMRAVWVAVLVVFVVGVAGGVYSLVTRPANCHGSRATAQLRCQ